MAATTRVHILGITMAVWTAAAIASTPSPILEFASRFHLKNITSPNYPSRYLGKTNCSWVIQSDYSNGAGYVIKVVFNEFSLYERYRDRKCEKSAKITTLSFYDGISPSTSRLLGTYCRSHSPDVIYSTGPFLYIELKIDTSFWYIYQQYNKFSISFMAVKKEGICSSPFSDSKVHRLHGSSGTFFSPFHYPRPYPRTNGSWSCTWVLSVSPGNMVNVKFEHLRLPFRGNDSVEVRDGQSAHDKMIKTYTKHGSYFEKSDVVLYSTGRYMWVRFNFSFDGRTGYQDRGFRAHFKATPRFLKTTCLPGNKLNPYLELTGNHGTLKSPMKYYPPYLYCRWLITVPEGKVVELTFVRIEIAFNCSGFRCSSYICHDFEDFVSVEWRGRNHTTVRKKYCGHLQKEAINEDHRLPDPILSPYSNLTVIFKSEFRPSWRKYTGFEATFKAVDKNSNGSSTKGTTIGVGVGVSVSVSVVVLIALVVSVVWFVRRRKARALSTAERDANVQMTRINARNTSPGTTRVTRVNASNTSPAPTRAVTTASHDTQTSPPPPQVAGQQSESRSPPPSLNSVPVQTIPSGPPPEYPYPLDSPPPYPGVEKALQYPPPGQSYPWLQSMPEPSAPPASP